MGLLSRLRAWLFGPDGEATGTTEPSSAETEDGVTEPHLDPENVTEVRTESDGDPVEKLRETRDEQDDGNASEGQS